MKNPPVYFSDCHRHALATVLDSVSHYVLEQLFQTTLVGLYSLFSVADQRGCVRFDVRPAPLYKCG